MPGPGRETVLSCSFCGKSQDQVVKLIAGPGVYICNECVDLCSAVVAEEAGDGSAGPFDAEIEAVGQTAMEAVARLRMLARSAQARPQTADPG